MARLCAHLSMLFVEMPPLERPRAAAEAGFTLVESWWPPSDDLGAWAAALDAAGLGVSCLNADGGDIPAGDRGFCNLPERDDDTFAAVGQALELARRVGAPNVNVLPGRLAPDRPAADQVAHAAEVYRELGRLAAAAERTIVVEPINALDVPGYLLPTPSAVTGFLEIVDHPRVRMLFDAYHCARAGGDPVRDVAPLVPVTSHVQYADCPGRGAPGTGEIDLDRFAAVLDDAGYLGAIGLEYHPAGPTVASLPALR